MGGGDCFGDLILRCGDEVEKGLEVDGGTVFAENEGCGGVVDAHLERV